MKQKYLIFPFLYVFSFFLNFFWESLHSFSLYKDHIIPSDEYVMMMLNMALLDAVAILLIYIIVGSFKKDILWIRDLSLENCTFFFILGIIVAFAAEYWAVFFANEWAYTPQMPTVFGVGLSPLVQLSITGLVSLWTFGILKNTNKR